MQVNETRYAGWNYTPDYSAVHAAEEEKQKAGEQAQPEDNRLAPAAQETEKSLLEQLKKLSKTETNFNVQTSRPKDSASALTKRLVAAAGQFEVRQVISQASSDMIGLRMIAALSKGKDAELARAYIRRLEKLISRAGAKIRELDEEDTLKVGKLKAEREQKRKRAEEIKDELRKRYTKRKLKENGYLQETGHGGQCSGRNERDDGRLDAASEAAISAQAEMIAAAEATSAGGDASMQAGAAEGGAAGSDGAAEGAEASGNMELSV